MRLFALIIATAALVTSGFVPTGPAVAASPAATADPEAAPPKIETLDTLLQDLGRESNPDEAERIAHRIRMRWRDSGSATGNLLMQWAGKAISEQKFNLAFDFLDQVTVLLPEYVEGWNQRATLNFMLGNYAKSMADINRVLAIEPRHFGALAGMAAILEARGNDRTALRAWEQLLEIYPANTEAQTKLGELAEKLAGRRT